LADGDEIPAAANAPLPAAPDLEPLPFPDYSGSSLPEELVALLLHDLKRIILSGNSDAEPLVTELLPHFDRAVSAGGDFARRLVKTAVRAVESGGVGQIQLAFALIKAIWRAARRRWQRRFRSRFRRQTLEGPSILACCGFVAGIVAKLCQRPIAASRVLSC
jgi:hypothetical protein